MERQLAEQIKKSDSDSVISRHSTEFTKELHANSRQRVMPANLIGAVAGMAVLLLLFLTDKSTHQWITAMQTHRFDKLMHAMRFAGHAWFAITLSALLWTLGIVFKNQKWQRTGRLIFGSLLFSGLIVLIAKPLFGRHEGGILGPPRPPTHGLPIQQTALYNAVDSHWGRFPSGDSTVAFSTATSLAIEFPAAAILFYLIAALTAFGRFYYSVHLLSDVVAGSWLGWCVARFLAARQRKHETQEVAGSAALKNAALPAEFPQRK